MQKRNTTLYQYTRKIISNGKGSAITDEEKKKVFMEEWQDGRASMKNIGEYAHQLGEKLKGKG